MSTWLYYQLQQLRGSVELFTSDSTKTLVHDFCRAMLFISAAYAVVRCPSVCRSVTFVNSVKTSSHILRLFSSTDTQTMLVFRYQTSWQYSDWDPLTGSSNAGGVGKNRDSRRITGYRSMTGGVRTTIVTVHRAVYHTYGDASVNLCLSQPAWTTTTKRKEENRIYLYAAVNLKRK